MTPADALDTFQRTRIDLLVLGSLVVRRSGRAEEAAEARAPARADREKRSRMTLIVVVAVVVIAAALAFYLSKR